MMVMLDSMDIQDCLIYLEKNSVTNEQIIEEMGCNRGTINDWWKYNKSSPKYLAKMRKFCTNFVPIPDLILCDSPPKYMFEDALDNQLQFLHENPHKQIGGGDFSGRYFDDKHNKKMAHSKRCLLQVKYYMGHPDYYETGIPIATSKRRTKYHTWRGHSKPNTKFKQLLCSISHPDKRVRDFFTSVLLKET